MPCVAWANVSMKTFVKTTCLECMCVLYKNLYFHSFHSLEIMPLKNSNFLGGVEGGGGGGKERRERRNVKF